MNIRKVWSIAWLLQQNIAVEREEGLKEGRLEEREQLLTNIADLIKAGSLEKSNAQRGFHLSNDEMRLLEERLAGVSLENNPGVEAKTSLNKKLAASDDSNS